ncbi:SpoIIE family protein phosphatase [Sansalvadorimonas sp. 2012CJ34-2]|uniref:SpoIIE family protein phosphatase n=1 Tax=Parendozoicomonas callyspongiae TaxID=2942213 RepID=A0ABT0PL59_9GAMM|nr:SpoIIE family protein phosphatase [Sansalvadorimonas sp. 2012CJ34-2]MCL6272103.1 SpoIIE family protein phosphatase [Sansalvadorimonas sp. 2012CJ34-2]
MSRDNTLLVIDDDTIVRESIVAYLSDSGFQILEAENGEHGLEVFRAEQPDLILCDLRMPKLDGLGVLRQVRQEAPDTPFIVVSGAGVMADVVEALRLGASDYIIKPIVDLEVLEYAINRALDNVEILKQNRRYRESLEEAIDSLKESLEVLRTDQKAGRQVQMKMLPHGPLQFGAYNIDYRIIPSLYLSGDFVDFFPVNDHCFGFYLADVSGHGASSAFVTVLLKHMSMSLLQDYRQKGKELPIQPSHVLSTINRNLLETALGKHVTVFGGVIDTQKNTLTYALGGHFPLPMLSMGGQNRFLEGKGLPVGLFDNPEFEDVTIDLSGPFTLTIFSDGILEVLPQDSLKEKEQYLLSAINEDADTVDKIMTRLDVQTMHEAPDDIAVMVLAGRV